MGSTLDGLYIVQISNSVYPFRLLIFLLRLLHLNRLYLKKLILLFLSLFCISTHAKTIVLGTTEWPPYVQNNANKGYAYDIVLAAFKAAGYDDVRIIFMPWSDAEKAANEGQLDAVFPEYFSQERTQTIVYTHSFSDSPVGFYKKLNSGIHYSNNHPEKDISSTLNALKQYRFGVVKGYVNIAPLDDNTQLHKIYTDSDEDNLKQLYDGKVDLVFIDRYTAEYLLHHQLSPDYSEQLVFMNPPLERKKLYVAISKKNIQSQAITAAFNKGLEIIKKNGVFSKIIDQDAETVDDSIG